MRETRGEKPKMTNQETTTPAESAERQERFCRAMPPTRERALSPDIGRLRARLIRYNRKKWANGTVLHYCFMEKHSDATVVNAAFEKWKKLGIGLEFVEVSNPEEAEVRVNFDYSDGSWSYVGRDVIDEVPDPNEPTMNFGWSLQDAYGFDTALHEIGHTLGFPHEHQNPNAGIVWNENKVYEYYRGEPNYWSDDDIRWNVLRKLDPGEVSGSQWDPNSIMHYWFKAGLIDEPRKYADNTLIPAPGLSAIDIREARAFYPSLKKRAVKSIGVLESKRLDRDSGQQSHFTFAPAVTREYTFQTFGTSDCVMVLFEDCETDGLRYVVGDDDSGIDRNAKLVVRLYRSRKYVLRVRLYYAATDAAVLVW